MLSVLEPQWLSVLEPEPFSVSLEPIAVKGTLDGCEQLSGDVKRSQGGSCSLLSWQGIVCSLALSFKESHL